MFNYNAKIEWEEDCYLVTFPDFDWGHTAGDTIEEALQEAQDCLYQILSTLINEDETAPEVNYKSEYKICPCTILQGKVLIQQTLKEKNLKRADLGRLLGLDNKSLQRLVSPKYKVKIDQIEKAMKALKKPIAFAFA